MRRSGIGSSKWRVPPRTANQQQSNFDYRAVRDVLDEQNSKAQHTNDFRIQKVDAFRIRAGINRVQLKTDLTRFANEHDKPSFPPLPIRKK